MKWKEAFYAGKREHPQEEKPASLTALLMPSLLGVAICLVCLCSLTWAWFTATQNSGVQPIQSATATVTASLNDTALGELKVGEPCSLNGLKYPLPARCSILPWSLLKKLRSL